VPDIEDAYEKIRAAEGNLQAGSYAVAVQNTQEAIELALKALLDRLGVNYIEREEGRKKYRHDVSDYLPRALPKLRSVPNVDFEFMRKALADASVALKMLTAIKEFATYGIRDMDLGSGDVFGRTFGIEIAKFFVPQVRTLCSWIGHCLSQVK